MNEQAVSAALEELQVLVESDGARFERLSTEVDDLVLLRLDLSGVECVDCVLPSGVLANNVQATLRQMTDDPAIAVEIDDPRDHG